MARAGRDVITSRYDSYQDAVADNLFGRGWLPTNIPRSSYRIRVSNNVSLNTSNGEFRFDPEDHEAFTATLTPYSDPRSPYEDFDRIVQRRLDQGYEAHQYIGECCVWIFFIDEEEGRVFYDMWPLDILAPGHEQ